MEVSQRFALDMKGPAYPGRLSLAYCSDCRAQYQFNSLTSPPLPRTCIICGQLLTVHFAQTTAKKA